MYLAFNLIYPRTLTGRPGEAGAGGALSCVVTSPWDRDKFSKYVAYCCLVLAISPILINIVGYVGGFSPYPSEKWWSEWKSVGMMKFHSKGRSRHWGWLSPTGDLQRKVWSSPAKSGQTLPSGYVKIAIENGHWNSELSHEKWWFSIVAC